MRMPHAPGRPLRVCFVNAFYDPAMRDGSDLIDRLHTLREFARSIGDLGHCVRVVQLFHRNEVIERDDVEYHFVRAGAVPAGMASAVARLRGNPAPAHYLPGTRMLSRIRSFQPDVIHFIGLTLDLNLWLVTRTARGMNVPLVAHYNGGTPPKSSIRRALQRRNLRSVDRLLFTTRQHAEIWADAGMPIDLGRVVPFMETSSDFRMKPREEARAITGMTGDPVFLWTGRLHPEKDPLVALRGFERIHACWPGARLYLYYLTDELLSELRAFVEERPGLTGAVHFRGRAPYEEMENIYNSADFFVQASHREASGLALLEALACGVIPIVSDIPSFRVMTDDGRYGVLFPIGDVDALVDGVRAIDRSTIAHHSAAIRGWWERELSFPALARQLDCIYRQVVGEER